jgi:CheY-like chemotaxis protein
MVYGLVKQSGGHIKVYSEIGHGTSVKLYLPRSTSLEDAPAGLEPAAAAGGSETILVVEDDEEVREITVALLSDLGYRVLKAPEAQSALAVVESGVKLDLLLTDVVMPGALRSPELARRAQALIPDLAVLFVSGYTENAIVHGGRLDPGVELLSKPYTREALARKVRHVLTARAARLDAEREAVPTEAAGGTLGKAGEAVPFVRILLAEDDDMIRATTLDMLESLGFEAQSAVDGLQALERLQAERFDVLITDRGLPGLSGDALAVQAVEIHPDLDVVFATGAAVAVPDPALEDAIFLIKPFTLADLQRAMEQCGRKGPCEGPESGQGLSAKDVRGGRLTAGPF